MNQIRNKRHLFSRGEDGFYRMVDKPLGKVKLPETFKIEEVWKKERVQAPYVIVPYRDGKRVEPFLTGLRPAFESNNWFYGDLRKKKDYLLIEFSPDKSKCTIVEFPNFYPHKMEWRIDFTLKFINGFYQSDII